jgi:transcriptional regulator GlxA family with amidase domain
MKKPPMCIGVLGFDGVNALDLTGPLEAFANANELEGGDDPRRWPYRLLVIGLRRGGFVAESGVRFQAHCEVRGAPALDTLIVPGGRGLRGKAVNEAAARWIAQRAPRTRRVVSVCTGIFGVAPTGLLDGRRVTTHWRKAPLLAQQYPALRVDGNALFLRDGKFYSGGGITAGIDLALALIEEDRGARAALAVAREMVVYLKRPGGQEQYSEPLRAQTRGSDRFADLVAWIEGHLDADLSVEALAQRACLSPRHFSRRFGATFGRSPADYVEDRRMGEARQRLTARGQTIEGIATALGFSGGDVFRRAFERRFGISPGQYRERFAASARA